MLAVPNFYSELVLRVVVLRHDDSFSALCPIPNVICNVSFIRCGVYVDVRMGGHWH